ncbi:hypothetical protein [Salinigranum marinum]|uniref:hypothetical protein n=1 Tax=Salinigranum marinum TaxID=1515595 RepID=UPI002989B6BE|nr:hypothetical protein [Salinigranum marinum]
MQPERGDIVRSSDAFKLGDDRQRPRLIVKLDAHEETTFVTEYEMVRKTLRPDEFR